MKTPALPYAWVQIRDAARTPRLSGTRSLLLIPLIVPLLALGCTPASDPPNPGNGAGSDGSAQTGDGSTQGSANSQACQVMRGGAFTAVTGIPRYTYSNLGPPIQNRQTYRVTLPDPPEPGHVSFKVTAAGEYVIFASRALPITVLTWDGTAVAQQSVASSVPECAEVKSRQTYNLVPDPHRDPNIKETHVIRLGGDSATAVDVVFTQGP